jgi:hypothetical protein
MSFNESVRGELVMNFRKELIPHALLPVFSL